MLVDHPIPHDKRFETVHANLETLGQHSTLNVPTLKNYSPRRELFVLPEKQPSYDVNIK
jgi:hypothetical protein